MKKYNSSETILSESGWSSRNSEIFLNDDNLHYSNIPISGSMSKSLRALNTYVKKNIFYDETGDIEENRNDSAFFSKETSPNKSVSKSDSDSLNSNISEQNIYSQTSISLNSDQPQNIINDQATLTDDYKFNKLLQNNTIKDTTISILTDENEQKHCVNQVNLSNENNLIIEHSKKAEIVILDTPKNAENIDNILKPTYTETQLSHKNKIDKVIPPVAPKRTTSKGQADYRDINVRTKVNHSNVKKKLVFPYSNDNSASESSNNHLEKYEMKISQNKLPLKQDIKPNKYSSLNINKKVQEDFQTDVTLRTNSLKSHNNNRHTIHDFTNWGNRTDIYPDVYAPLPYSK